jgi:5-methylcytosine-specific restriction protein A
VSATQVDHIKAKAVGGTDEDNNLQPLCGPCHKAKTAREANDRR